MTRRRMGAGLVVAAAVMAACGGGADGGEPDAVAGRTLFQTNCAQCHGPMAEGTQSGPPLVHEVYLPDHHSDAAFVMAVQQGVQPHHFDFGPMPPIPSLSEEEIADITAYVRELQRDAGLLE